MRLIDRLRVVGRWGIALSVALVVALVSWTASADDPCTKRPDLWLPPDGTPGLANGGISVQETSGDVCQGDIVTITVTIDNLSCGDAGPFDVRVYYDDLSHIIGTQHVDGLLGCEFTVLTFTWDTGGAPTGEHEILACADTGNDVVELNEGNNCLTIDTSLIVSPNAPLIEATKTDVDSNGGTVQPGDEIRYEIVIRNFGCADLVDNPGHEFTDTLPAGLTATGFATASSGTITVVGDEIFWDGGIPAGGEVILVFRTQVDADVEELTEICNQGFVEWDSNGDGTNDSVEPTDDPDTPGDDDPSCFTVESTPEPPMLTGTVDAPTLSEWGMILLSTLLALAFLWKVSARRVVVTRRG